jgi:hypothetical protein
MIVTGVHETLNVLEEKLGIPAGIPVRRIRHGAGFDAAYFSINEDLNLTASGIQMLGISPLRQGEPESELGRELGAMLLAYITSQPMYRPLVSHVTALGTPAQADVDEIIEILKSRGVPHIARIDNVYIGLIEDNGRIYYDPEVDGGTLLEFAIAVHEYPGLIRPPTVPAEPEIANAPPGALIRPLARTHLAVSVEAIIERLRAIVDWPEDEHLEYVDGDGYRSIIIKPNHPLSAVWELVEPTRADSRAGKALAKYGPGVWSTRLGVYGLDAKLDDLDKRGTGWERIAARSDAERVALNRWDLRGLTLELEDMPVVLRGEGAGRV